MQLVFYPQCGRCSTTCLWINERHTSPPNAKNHWVIISPSLLHTHMLSEQPWEKLNFQVRLKPPGFPAFSQSVSLAVNHFLLAVYCHTERALWPRARFFLTVPTSHSSNMAYKYFCHLYHGIQNTVPGFLASTWRGQTLLQAHVSAEVKNKFPHCKWQTGPIILSKMSPPDIFELHRNSSAFPLQTSLVLWKDFYPANQSAVPPSHWVPLTLVLRSSSVSGLGGSSYIRHLTPESCIPKNNIKMTMTFSLKESYTKPISIFYLSFMKEQTVGLHLLTQSVNVSKTLHWGFL